MPWTHPRPPRAGRGGVLPLLPGLLAAVLLLVACNDGDKKEVTGPDGGDVAGELFNADVFCELGDAIEQAAGLLFTGGGSIPGEGGGQIVVEGQNFTFDQYSPDGVYVLDGGVVLNLLVAPATVKGSFTWSDGQDSGEILVDMTVDATADPITFGGTLTFDGQAVDLDTVDLPDCANR